MCSATDDPSRHDLDIKPSDFAVNNAAEALAFVFAHLNMMPPSFWDERIEDLAHLGYMIVPLAVNLTEAELVVAHDHLVRTLARS